MGGETGTRATHTKDEVGVDRYETDAGEEFKRPLEAEELRFNLPSDQAAELRVIRVFDQVRQDLAQQLGLGWGVRDGKEKEREGGCSRAECPTAVCECKRRRQQTTFLLPATSPQPKNLSKASSTASIF